jgi:predicted O-linked N-acetylglucosamine transferase (SPINDLY family)
MDDFRIQVPADEVPPPDIGFAVGEFRLLPTHYQSILAAGQIPADQETILLYLAGRYHRSSSFWDLLAKHHHTSGDVTGALAACHRGWLLEPGSRPRAHLLANMAIAANAAEPMIATMRDYSILHPSRSEPHAIRGLLLRHVGALSAAIDAVEVAIALTTDKAELWLLLMDLLNRSAMTKKAVQVSAKAIAHAPENPNLLNNAAAIMIRQHHHVAAKRYLEKALRLSGLTEVNLCNYANALLYRGSQEGAVEVARAAMALKPRAVLPRRSLVNTLPYHPSTTGASLLRESRAVSSRIPRSERTKARGGEREKRPLTVGLLSGNLRTHPVGWLTLAALDGLPRDRFRFVCLSGPFQDNDPFSRRFRALSGDWIDFSGMTDDDLIAQARERDIDIILDLGGHGDGGRMVACANRLAPCQIKWVGMQNHSTGLAEMDWFITDRWETPPAAETLYSERMLRLPDGYICYEPPPHAPPVGPSPALRNGHLTFGCFNNIAKITEITINLWAEIMHRIPDAVLMIKAHQLEDTETAGAFMRRFERNGIAADRVRLEGPSAHRSFLDCYNRVDIALDPFPYSGGLTTCEALWMGVPTIALHAETFASRHSVSHLSNAGFADWVTHTAEEYVARAVAWSRSMDTLVKLRASMRARVRASGLCDVLRFADGLALALTHAWRTSRG